MKIVGSVSEIQIVCTRLARLKVLGIDGRPFHIRGRLPEMSVLECRAGNDSTTLLLDVSARRKHASQYAPLSKGRVNIATDLN